VWNSWKCRDGGQTAQVYLLEPTQARNNPAYIAKLKRQGYDPKKSVVLLKAKHKSRLPTDTTSGYRQAKTAKPRLEIGMKICKQENNQKTIGFV
jgi:hypothetical protein